MAEITTNNYEFPNRYITGHDEQGNSIFTYEGQIQGSKIQTPNCPDPTLFAVPWESTQPADLNDDTDTANPGNIHLHHPNGHTARFVVSPPHSSSPMHRTETIDYDVIISGEIELELEGGGRRTLKAGDVIVQRGTNHAWHNTTDKPTVFLAVMISAELPSPGGKKVEALNHDAHRVDL